MPTYIIYVKKNTVDVVRVTKDDQEVPWAVGSTKRVPPFYLVTPGKTIKAFKLKFYDEKCELTPILSTDFSVVEENSEPPTKVELQKEITFKVTLSGNLSLHRASSGAFTGFEGDQGNIHFDKHGKEFDCENKAAYIRLAKAFGEDTVGQYMDFCCGNTFVRCDLPSKKSRRVFVANLKSIRTFYMWSEFFSRDPFAFAIVYTIESLEGRGRRAERIEQFRHYGIDYGMGCEDIDIGAAVIRLTTLFGQKSYIKDLETAVHRWMPDIVAFYGRIPTPDEVDSWVNLVWIDD